MNLLDLKTMRQQLDKSGHAIFEMATGSMEPLICIGDKVEVVPLKNAPHVFDIIVFWANGRLVCHFVSHINELPLPDGTRAFITRSLDGPEDLPVSEALVLGLVVSHRLSMAMKLKTALRALWRRIKRGVLTDA